MMKRDDLKIQNFTGGWLVGDFKPSLFKSKDIEVGLKMVPKGFVDDAHYHKLTTEYNFVVNGKMLLENGEEVSEGDCFICLPYEISKCRAVEDTTILVIRDGSFVGDKYLS